MNIIGKAKSRCIPWTTVGTSTGVAYGVRVLLVVMFIAACSTRVHATPERIMMIEVVDTMGRVIPNANVTILPLSAGQAISFPFDSARGGYVTSVDVTVPAVAVIRSSAFPTVMREIPAGRNSSMKVVMGGSAEEGKAPLDGTWRTYVKYPRVLGVARSIVGKVDDGALFLNKLHALGLRELIGEWELLPAVRGGAPIPMLITNGAAIGDLLRTLRGDSTVAAAGPIFRWEGSQVAIFTRQLWVRPKPEVPADEVRALLEREGLEVEGYHTFFQAFSASADVATGEEIIDIAHRLIETGKVQSADVVPFAMPEADRTDVR